MAQKIVRNVFLSSVSEGLESYRQAMYEAIEMLDGYHCVRMENFGARAIDSAEFCIDAVKSCELFVGIVGQRYGSCPPDSELSFSEIEYNSAVASGIPPLMFVAPDEFPIPASLIETDEKRQRLKAFRNRVLTSKPTEFFSDAMDLKVGIVVALHNHRTALLYEHAGQKTDASMKTNLLFPWVTCSGGYDTGIAIAHTGADPFGTVAKAGACTIHYYGTVGNSAEPAPQTSSVVMPGEVLTYVVSSGSLPWALDSRAAGFSGYVIVECDFPHAYGYAHLGTLGAHPISPGVSAGYLATVIKPDRSSG